MTKEQLDALKGHTPGPWAVAEDMGWEPTRSVNYEIAIVDCGAGEIKHIHEACVGISTDKTNHIEPNARLIAAAPDLLNHIDRQQREIERLRKATRGLLDHAVILSRDYLDAFRDYRELDTIQGWDKRRWLRAADAADEAEAALKEAGDD